MPLRLLLLLVASFLRLPPPASAACSPKTCGDLTVAYPFWLEEAGQPPCGSPSFQLRCNGTRALLAHSVFGQYQVVRVFTENSSFVAVDHNLLVPSPGGCPKWWFNVSDGIGLAPYTISRKNRELLVLYHCTEWPPQGFIPTPCRRNGSSSSFFRLGDQYGGQSRRAIGLPPACRLSVVPVLGFPAGDEYVGGMKGGFLLEWTMPPSDSCPRCVASGGQCRYRNDSAGFSCNCSGATINFPLQSVVLSTSKEIADVPLNIASASNHFGESKIAHAGTDYDTASDIELLSRICLRRFMSPLARRDIINLTNSGVFA